MNKLKRVKSVSYPDTAKQHTAAYIVSDDSGVKYSAIANTRAMDRDKEVVLPEGCLTDDFMKNPVMLDAHAYHKHAVGKVTAIEVGKEVTFDFEFAPTDDGRELKQLYDEKFQSAFSVGFMPKEYVIINDDTPEKMVVDVNGKDIEIDLAAYEKAYGEKPHYVITLWSLLEISPVPVPSNPEALLTDGKQVSVQLEQIAKARFAEESKRLTDAAKDGIKGFASGIIEPHTVPVSENEVDEKTALAAMIYHSLGTEKGEQPDWDKFKSGDADYFKLSKGFGWLDTENAAMIKSYKFIHHTAEDGELKLAKSLLFESMAKLLDKKEAGEDSEDVHKHLEKHYADIDIKAPAYGDYSAEEIESISSKGIIEVKEVDESTDDQEYIEPVNDKLLNAFMKFQDDVSIETLKMHQEVSFMLDIMKTLAVSIEGLKEVEQKESDDEDLQGIFDESLKNLNSGV